MPSAADDIVARINANGPLRFDDYLRTALYGEHGFYITGGGAGRRADFITSPEVGPLFGVVLARFIEAEWQRLGQPADFVVIEAGAGPGTLARSVTAALASTASTPRYVAVELSARQRAAHPDGVESVAELPAGPVTGVIVANELLDNLPFRLLVFDGGWREAFVMTSGERFVEILRPCPELPAWLPESAAHGARAPWQHDATAWVQAARSKLAAGSVLAFDYATPRTAELTNAPWREWLRTYRQHARGGHYLTAPGEQDITAQVAVDQLPEADTVETQQQFLRAWGIDELVDEGRREWIASAAAPTVAAMKMRSRVREAEALLDPGGLGAFLALQWTSLDGAAN